MRKKRKQQAASKEPISEMTVNTESSHQDEDNYRIYTYLKNNPGLFAGSGAVIIAILSALISLCSYVYENAYLRYWMIDPVYIKLDTANRIYGSIVSFFFLCTLLVSFAIIDSIAEMASISGAHSVYLKQLKKTHRKHIRSERRKKLFAQLLHTPFAEDVNIQYVSDIIDQLEKNTRESRKAIYRQVFISLVILCAALTISLYFWICVVTPDSINAATKPLPAAAASSAIIILPLFWVSTCFTSKKRSSKRQAALDYSSRNIKTDIPEISLPIKKLLSIITCFKQPDDKIRRFLSRSILFILFVSLTMTLAFDYFGTSKAEAQLQFLIITQTDADYAIMYNNGEYAILARCSQNKSGNTITIDPSFQQVISIEGIKYEIVSFEKVYKDVLPDCSKA